MMTDASEAAEVRSITLEDPQGEWHATLEAFSGRHMRISLAETAKAPRGRWNAGAQVRVCLRAGSRTYSTPASVIKQIGSVIWLAVSPSFAGFERRASQRVPVRLPVRCSHHGTDHDAWCLDLSAGGMRLSLPTHVDVGDELDLQFLLPGSRETLHVRGRSLWVAAGPSGRVEAGVKFIALQPTEGSMIADFCARQAPVEGT